MLIVGVPAGEVEGMLACGVGPRVPAWACCPVCGGELRGFWAGYERTVRLAGGRRLVSLRIGRTRCVGRCRKTHALVPSLVVPRRLDAAEVIGAALELAAAGLGHRQVAARLVVPATTVRGWLRRARARVGLVSSGLWRFAMELGVLAPRPPPGERPLAGLLRAVWSAHAAAVSRFGGEGLPDCFGLCVCLLGDGLLGAHGLALVGRVGGVEDRVDQ